ncbi:DNA primase family protein [Enterococcus dongliensis]|uniref:Phage/plasmid primase, P4 family n=1 Tax=Enterococcus dongliensis TaxID=2559925 RepID=A0ABU3ETQ7_9ENTE|nr:phage/plasmid primase, P4 family [Enterococcus dongliensis]MDT2598082.1 phage/plasmid primase, P4 family [Enterococcus dongliensis]
MPDELKQEFEENPISQVESKKAFDINLAIKDLIQQADNLGEMTEKIKFLEEQTEKLKLETPNWFWIILQIKRNKKGEPTGYELKNGFDPVVMGDILITQYNLVRFPKLDQGAVYDTEQGSWRYFGKDEMISFVRKETIDELRAWGFFEMDRVYKTSSYVFAATYDKSFPNETPFILSKPELAVFKNGTYNILTNEIRENDPKDYILNSYDYELPVDGRETPKTDSFLKGMFGDSWLFLKQFIGYGFYRSHSPAQEIVFLYGDGGEGKSTFLNFLTECIFNRKNVSAEKVQDLSADKFAKVNLLGKSMNISAEIPKGNMKNSDILKMLTGGDMFMGQYKGIQAFAMVSYAKLMFSANKLPGFRDLTGGFSHRLVVIKAINGNQREKGATFFKDHPMEEIIKEAPYFAYSCIQEFRKVFDGKKATFTKTSEMEQDRMDWLYENNYLGQFFTESCEINPDDEMGTSVKTIMAEYQAYCKQNGIFSESPQEVRNYLEALGCKKEKNTKAYNEDKIRVWRYMGCKLTTSYIHSHWEDSKNNYYP